MNRRKKADNTIDKAYKYRLYPTSDQIEQIYCNFDCVRYVYNHFLALRTFTYEQKRGIEAYDETVNSGNLDVGELDRIIESEKAHFNAIWFQSCSKQKKDLSLLRAFVPDVYVSFWAWALKEGLAQRDQKVPSFFDTSKMLTQLKKEVRNSDGNLFLKEADAVALIYALRNLDAGFQNFFNQFKKGVPKRKVGYPRFKEADGGARSYKTSIDADDIDYQGGTITLPKIGPVDCVFHRQVEGRPYSVTVSEDSSGRFWASIGCDGVAKPNPRTVGHDLAVEVGVEHAAVTSDGVAYDRPDDYERYRKRLAFEERRLSQMIGAKKGEAKSKRYLKQRKRVNRLHAKLADMRNDFLHCTSRSIVDSGDVFYMRDNDVAGMQKNKKEKREGPRFVERKRHENNTEASMAELVRQISYKATWEGSKVVMVDSEYPSTQRCSVCGDVNEQLAGVKGLPIREWTCPTCGAHHKRDVNSAANIYQKGRRMLEEAL